MSRNNFPTKRRNIPAVHMDERHLKTARHLIANMVVAPEELDNGIVSHVKEQGIYELKPDYLPMTGFEIERKVLALLYRLAEANIPATYQNILQRLELDDPDAKPKFDALMEYRHEFPEVFSQAFNIGDWLEYQRLAAALREALIIAERGSEDVRVAYADMLQMITSAAPMGGRQPRITGTDLMRIGLEHQKQLEARLDAGGPAGPNFPWKGMNEKVPALTRGDMMLWIAKSGHGKTSLSTIMAEHWAYKQGYDVAYFHLETSPFSIYRRLLARRMLVKPNRLRDGTVRTDRKPWTTRIAEVDQEIREAEQAMGRIYYLHSPGITPSQLEAQIAEHKALADARGRELIVIVDYYTEIDHTEFGSRSDAEGHNAIADFLKRIAESDATHCYMVALAQANIDQDLKAKRTPFNGSKIFMRSQVVVYVEREMSAEYSEPWLDEHGNIRRDSLGEEIYFHRQGQPDSKAIFNIVKANDDSTGEVYVRFVNGYFIVRDRVPPEQEITSNGARPTNQPDFQ